MKTANNDLRTRAKRIDYIDIARGIALLMVIIGHTVGNQLVRGAIFSVHMPLFFLLSGFSGGNVSSLGDVWKKSKKFVPKLILLAVGLFFFRWVCMLFIAPDGSTFTDTLEAVLFASGTTVESKLFGEVYAIGMVWFMFVLAGARVIWLLLGQWSNAVRNIACLVLTCAGVIIGQIVRLPFSLDLVLAVMAFMLAGGLLKNWYSRESVPKYTMPVSAAVWAAGFIVPFVVINDYLELAGRRYPWFPLCYITAVAGCVMIVEFSRIIQNVKIAAPALKWIGANSLVVFSIHYLDCMWGVVWQKAGPLDVVVRLVIDMVLSVLVVYVINIIKKRGSKA